MAEDRELAQSARAWPFEEARKLVKRLGGKTPDKGYVLLETGYGPSGLPHIGTLRRGGAHHHGAPSLPAPLGRADPAVLLLRRHGRPAQGAGQHPEPGDGGPAPGQAADPDPRSLRHRRELRRTTTTPACAPSWTPSASSTSSVLDGAATARARFDQALLQVLALPTTRSWRSCCRLWGPSGRRPTAPSCRSAPRPAGCCRCRWSSATCRGRHHRLRGRGRQPRSRCR